MVTLSTVKVCGICGATVNNANICTDCLVKLSTLITRAGITQYDPHHVLCVLDELDLQMSRQSRAAPRFGGPSAETPIPFDSSAAKAHSVLSDLLTSWARHYGAPVRALSGPRRCADWIYSHLRLIVLNDGVEVMYTDIDRACADALLLMDNPEPKDYIGICSSFNRGVFCNVDLYAAQGIPLLTCPRCGTVHDVGDRRAAMFSAADDLLLSGVDIARIAGVMGIHLTADVIYKWRNRGRLNARATNSEGHPMYRLGDVLQLAHAAVLRSR